MYTVDELNKLTVKELNLICANNGYKKYSKLNKKPLIDLIMSHQNKIDCELEKHLDLLFSELSGVVYTENDYYELQNDLYKLFSENTEIAIQNGVLNLKLIQGLYENIVIDAYFEYLKHFDTTEQTTTEQTTTEQTTTEQTTAIEQTTIDTDKLSFKYTELEKNDTIEFLENLIKCNDKDEVMVFCQNYIDEKRDSYSVSKNKKFLANIRHCLSESRSYIATLVDEDLLDDDLLHIVYKFVKLPNEYYEKSTKQDVENRNLKIDNKVELTDSIIAEYLVKSVEYLNQRDNWKLCLVAVCALTGRRMIEVFRLITDYDIDEKYTLTITRNQLAKNKNDNDEVETLNCYCLVESEMIANAIDWLRNESGLKDINERFKDENNEQIKNRFKTTINDTVKKYYDFVPSPSTKETLSIHNLRSVAVCLMVQFFTNESNDIDLFLKKCLGHSGESAKDYYKSYYVSAKSGYERGYLLSSENQQNKTLVISDNQFRLIEELGGIDEVLRLATTATKYDTTATIKTTNDETDTATDNIVKIPVFDEFNGYKPYRKIKQAIDKIKAYNDAVNNDSERIALTSTAIYQITGVRTDTISNFRNETGYGDFDSYNNQFDFSYRQNSGRDLKTLLGY